MTADLTARRSILVVDDNPDMRESLKLLLEADGYAVRVAGNGDHALKVQQTEPSDLLITDLFMPGRDGFETLASFREAHPRMPIIVISGDSSTNRKARADYLQAADLLGAEVTLRKPFQPQVLLDAVRRLLG